MYFPFSEVNQMLYDFLGVYSTLHLFYIGLALYILHKFSQDIATQLEYTSFRCLIFNYLIYVLTSVSATSISYELAPMPRWFIALVWYLNLLSVVLIALCLYMYAVFRYASHITQWRWFTVLSSIPVSIIFLCLLVSLKNGIVFSVGADNRIVFGPVYPALPLLATLYFVAILIFAYAKFRLTRSYVRRKQLTTLMISILFVFVSVVVDERFRRNYLTILPTAALCAIVYLYINLQEGSIYTDALTGMNNRRKALEYLGPCLDAVSEDTPLYLYMRDVNSFKKINDGYGHAEGDQALVLAADAIKEAIAKYDGFAARYGGDEFLLSCFPHGDAPASPESLIADVDRAIAGACKGLDKPYSITLSMGYARCADPSRPLTDYIREADEMLYERKRAFHKIEQKA